MISFVSLSLISPLLTKKIVDDVIYAGEFGPEQQKILYTVIVFMIIIATGRAGLSYVRTMVFEQVSQNVIYDLRTGLYEHLSSLPYRFYDKHKIGEIMSRMTGDIESIRAFIANGLIQLVEQAGFYFASLIIIFILSPKVALVLFTTTPVLAYLGIKFKNVIHPAFYRIREQNAVLNTRTQENIAGTRMVKAFDRQDYERERFNEENYKQMNLGIKIVKIFAKYHPMMEFISAVTPALLILVGGYLAHTGVVTSGDVVAIFGYLWMLTGPTRNLGNLLNMVTQTIASGEKIFYYCDFGSYIKEKENPEFPEEFKGHISFENVSFAYGDEPVLEDISFDLPAGKTLAIMGATGSGKTSIVNLFGRFYECHKGYVKIDGIDVKDYELKKLRKQIGYVMQETFLFSDSLAGNIAFGNLDVDMDDVKAAADIAQASPFIAEKDDGYDLIVGERGTGLSGGQKQRTAIARALLVDPKILVLDDSTASVDMETEHLIQEGLNKDNKERTTVIISHRISAVQDADEIIVLDDGKIAERGKHKELLALQGLYYDIFMDQYQDYLEITKKEVV